MTSTVRAEFTDADVKRRIDTFLSTRHFSSFRNLEVDVDDGAVTVTGKLGSFYAKQVALSSCQRVAGVQELIDSIEVVVDPDSNQAPLLAEQA